METGIEQALLNIKARLENYEIIEAIQELLALDAQFTLGYDARLRGFSGRFKSNMRDKDDGIVTADEFKIERNKISVAVNNLVAEIPQRAARNAAFANLATLKTTAMTAGSADNVRLEKIIGVSNIMPINWFLKAAAPSRAVCRILRTDREVGTGWLIPGGYLMTNNHVLPSADKVDIAEAQFNFEIDANGNATNMVSYKLDSKDFITSPEKGGLDVTRVKVIDRADKPLVQWGALDMDAEYSLTGGEVVTIIQHPRGIEKQVSLGDIVANRGFFTHYLADTDGGSSGSPIFNKNWKVVGIHHAGGKYDVDGSGRLVDCNQGILIKDVVAFLNKK